MRIRLTGVRLRIGRSAGVLRRGDRVGEQDVKRAVQPLAVLVDDRLVGLGEAVAVPVIAPQVADFTPLGRGGADGQAAGLAGDE